MIELSVSRIAIGMALLAVALAEPGQATAQQLPPVAVVATRQPQPVDDSLADLTVIDRQRLEAQGGRTLGEVLARLPGIQRGANGGPGTASNLFIRGAEARHTLLLIDGVPYGSATLGTPVWDTVPLEQIERVEILRGPASALYGSSALGGVVHVITRQAVQGFVANGGARAGSRDTAELTSGFAGGEGPWAYALQGQHFRTRGISAKNAKSPASSFDPDDDGFRQSSLSGRMRFRIDERWSLDAGALVSDGLVHLDDGPSRDARTAQRTEQMSARLEGRVARGWNSALRIATNSDRTHAIEAARLPSDFATRTHLLSWQNDVATPVGALLLGAEGVRQAVDSSTHYAVTERDIRSLIAGVTGTSGAHHWQANLRRDDNSQFGGYTTGALGYGLDVAPAWRITVRHGTSFIAPSFNQLYFPGFGNPNLQPERGRSEEVGLRWNGATQSVRLTVFESRIRGFFDKTDPTAAIARARIDGLSLAWETRWSAFMLNAGLDLMRPRNEGNGRHLPRRADRQFTLGVGHRHGPFTWGAGLLALSERFDDSANTPAKRLPGFATLDLHASYRWRPEWAIEARVDNLAGRVYETAYGFNQPGRMVYLGVRFAPRS